MEYVRLTNSNNIAVFPMQFIIIEILLAIKTEICKIKFSEFAEEWTRIFSQRVPGRNSIDKDGGGQSRPEKAEYLHGRQNSTSSMRKIQECQASWDSEK
jgi:hypothetical protein